MKEMYLKVRVEQSSNDLVDVFYRRGRYFTTLKDDTELVEIEDAEERGAEKLAESISYIIGELVNGESQKVGEAFGGRVEVSTILQDFSPKEINYRVEKMKHHVPTQGDVYTSKNSGNTAVILETKDGLAKMITETYIISYREDEINQNYEFTGKTIDVSELANVFDKKGDNT